MGAHTIVFAALWISTPLPAVSDGGVVEKGSVAGADGTRRSARVQAKKQS
jgi:hypothetical protein